MPLQFLLTETFHPILATELRNRGFAADVFPGISQEEVIEKIPDYDAIVVATRIRCNREVIDRGKKLKLILRAGSGMEMIDVAYAELKRITCISSPEGNANAVGEHATGLLLSLFHNIVKSARETAEGKWLVEENRTTELEGKTLGIIGYGNTGKAFARKLSPFSMRVLAHDKYLSRYGDSYATESTPDRLFKEAEIISLHVPLTTETLQWIDYLFWKKFDRAMYFINTSRGKIVDHAGLLQAVQNGLVKAAALDVYENENFGTQSDAEKKTFHELIQTGRVFFTPHIAGKSVEAKQKIAQVLIKKVDEWGKNFVN